MSFSYLEELFCIIIRKMRVMLEPDSLISMTMIVGVMDVKEY